MKQKTSEQQRPQGRGLRKFLEDMSVVWSQNCLNNLSLNWNGGYWNDFWKLWEKEMSQVIIRLWGYSILSPRILSHSNTVFKNPLNNNQEVKFLCIKYFSTLPFLFISVLSLAYKVPAVICLSVSSPLHFAAQDIIALIIESQHSQIHYWCRVSFLL